MTDSEREAIAGYIEKVGREWRSGQATEHTYRPMLKELVEALLPRVTAVNEPKHIACGAPDYLLRRGADILGFIEAKDLGDGDLDGRGAHREQFDRYKESLDTLCFTDYLDFHFYDRGDFVDSVRIAEPKGERLAPADDAALDRFVQLVSRFAEARPQRIGSPARLARLMAGKARLLAAGVRQYLGREENADSMLAQQMEAFRRVLIHDIDADSFADVFAQTVTYGMFAARLHDSTPEDFSRAEAATLIPKTNPLLRQMFQYIAMDTDDSIEWIVDDLVSLFAAVDVEKLMRDYGKDTQKADPLLHFYEDFLAAYDPKLRKVRGVWNTPTPVVDFIVRSVDSILTRDFNLPGGLADPAKVKIEVNNDTYSKNSRAHEKKRISQEVHRVQILDPAAGTGTFIAEAVKLIHAKVVAAMGEGAWQGYVADNLLPRLNGFEILMASYAMAHLKLDMLLSETGYEHRTNERLRVFLTNSLEPYDKEIGTLFAAALSQEANEANFVKRDCPVMVVMGNPPYSVSSANKGEWIQEKIADYKKGLGEKKLNLDDDYIKFLRLGQYYVEKNGEGVLAFISNNSFVDGITHRQMRKSLLESFDEIYILNLHGNARKKEMAPDGGKDENVFDIMQGVSINIFVKRGKVNSDSSDATLTLRKMGSEAKPLAVVHYADLYGVREDKYAFLDANALESVKWQTLELQEPYYFFVPKDFGLQEEYEKGFRIDELMPVYNSGIQTKCDALCLKWTEKELVDLLNQMRTISVTELMGKYPFCKAGRDWSLEWAQKDVVSAQTGQVVQVQYKPFDLRFTYYTGNSKGFIAYPRANIGAQVRSGNVFLATMRQLAGTKEDCEAFVSEWMLTDRGMYSTNGTPYLFPLYLYETSEANLIQVKGKAERRPNFDEAVYAKICAAVNSAPDLQASANPMRNEIREFLCGEPVARLTGHEFEDVKGRRSLVAAIYESFARVGRVVRHPTIGLVRLTKSGTKDSLMHGFGRAKLAAFAALPEIIAAGRAVSHSRNWKGRGYDSFVLTAPVEIDREPHCAFVIVNRMHNGDCNYYLHEVGKLAEIKKIAGGLRAGHPSVSDVDPSPGNQTAEELRSRLAPYGGEVDSPFGLVRSLAYSIFAVNGGSENFRPTPEDVFNYIYGVLHTPGYREKYREFLKIDFPRIPYPKGAAEFRRIAAVGEKLVKVHLLKDDEVTNPFANPYAKFAGDGDGVVQKVVFQSCTSGKDSASPLVGRVYINGGQWFEPVSEEAWNFYIGGYQPAQKWLKDRKGRKLTSEDLQHYRAIIAALVKTSALMKDLQ